MGISCCYWGKPLRKLPIWDDHWDERVWVQTLLLLLLFGQLWWRFALSECSLVLNCKDIVLYWYNRIADSIQFTCLFTVFDRNIQCSWCRLCRKCHQISGGITCWSWASIGLSFCLSSWTSEERYTCFPLLMHFKYCNSFITGVTSCSHVTSALRLERLVKHRYGWHVAQLVGRHTIIL